MKLLDDLTDAGLTFLLIVVLWGVTWGSIVWLPESWSASSWIMGIFMFVSAVLTAGGCVAVWEWFRDGGFTSGVKELVMIIGASFRSDKSCTWCGSRRVAFDFGSVTATFWEYRNKDGSKDKRVADNTQLSTYDSQWTCNDCGATSEFRHYSSEEPSRYIEVWRGMLLKEGTGERTAKNYERGAGKSFSRKEENRKGK